MTEPSQIEIREALRIWRSRQTTDGFLVAAVLGVAFAALLFFILKPGQAAATALVVSLAAVVLASARLVQSAANVVRIRSAIRLQLAIADVLEAGDDVSVNRLN